MMREPAHIALLRAVLRLYPASFRRRHGDDVIASARSAARQGRTRGAWVIADALGTLVRAWAGVVRDAAMRQSPRRAFTQLTADARFAGRSIRRDALQSFVLIATLAVAIGANASIYTVAHALLLERLPYASPEDVVEVKWAPVGMQLANGGVTWKPGSVLSEHPGVEQAATYYVDAGANLVAGRDASRVRITQVSPAFFPLLGVRMLLGSGSIESGANDAVLAYGLWRTAFGSDRGVIGRTIRLNGLDWRISGVAPEGVDFPAGTQLWLSDPPVSEYFGNALGPSVIARLQPGARASVEAALLEDSDVRRADAGESAEYITDPELIPLRDYLTTNVRLPLLVLAGAAVLVLLLGCVNVAGVSLARIAARTPELATRRALGASQGRVFVQLLVELCVIAAVAGVLGVLLTISLIPALVSLLPAGTAGLDTVRAEADTLLFVGVLTVLAALGAGVPPAFAGARDGRGSLQPDRLRGDDRRGHRFQGVLTTTQVALAVLLVAGASLLGRSLIALQAVPLGYDTRDVLTFSVRLPMTSYGNAADARRYIEDVRARLAALPGIDAVGVVDRLPLADGMGVGGRVRRAGTPADAGGVTASQFTAGSDYFAALGIDVLAGRTFSDDAAHEVVLSRSLAVALFDDRPAVGERVAMRSMDIDATVVGVVADVRDDGAESDLRPAIYLPLQTTYVTSPSFAIRTSAAPGALMPAIHGILAEVDPAVAPHALRTTRQAAAETLAARRATAIVAMLFAVASLALCVLAVYSLLAQGVARRRRELGIRLALGATRRHLETLIVGRSIAWALPGLVAGILLSLAAARLIDGLLYGVAPGDPGVLALTASLVLIAAVAASWIPARRAGRLDPVTSLRGD